MKIQKAQKEYELVNPFGLIVAIGTFKFCNKMLNNKAFVDCIVDLPKDF